MSWIDDMNAAPDVVSYNDFFKQSKLDSLQRQRKSSQMAKTKKKDEGGLASWLPTIGGLGGSIAGGVGAGALAGSVVPGIGTAAGAGVGLLGAILGGALGSGAGKVGENALEGNNDLGQGVAGEALLGGATSVGPIRGINAIVKGGKALATGAGKMGTLEALGKATTETPIRNMLGGTARKASDDLAVKSLRLNPSQVTNYKGKFGEDVSETIRKQGLQGTDAAGIGAKRATLDDGFSNIVSSAPDVSKNNVLGGLTDEVNRLKASGPSAHAAMADNLLAEATDTLAKYGDNIPASELNKLRRSYDSLVNYTEKAANPDKYGVNKRMADGLRGSLQSTADDAGLSVNGQSLKDVGMNISKLRSLEKIATKQEGLGRGSGPLGMRDLLGAVPGGIAGAAVGGPAGGLVGALATGAATKALNSRPVLRAGSKMLDKFGGGAATGDAAQYGLGVPGQVGRFGAVGVAQNGLNAEADGSGQLDEYGLAPEDWDAYKQALQAEGIQLDEPGAGASMGDGLGGQPQQPSNPFGISLEDVGAQMKEALTKGDTKGYGVLSDLYDRIYQYESDAADTGKGSDKALTQGAQERADLIKSLGLTEGAVNAGSINYGPIGSRVEDIKSIFNAADPETLSFRNMVSGLQAAITKARAGTSLTDGEKALLMQYTPNVTDSEQQVRSKLEQLRNLYGS